VDYNYNVAVVTEIDNMTEYMNKIRAKILTFWENQPEILIRLPPHCFEITPALFLSKDYSPYTMGKKMMPSWVDPMVVAMMNEARKIYQTEEQTMKQREKYFKYLTLMTRTKRGISSEIVNIISEYMTVNVVFDLLQSISPSQFLGMDNNCEIIHCQNSISVYV